MKRAVSPVFFVLAAACFFLPFFSVSCQGLDNLGDLPGAEGEFPEVTGYEVVTGAAQDEFEAGDDQAAEQFGGDVPDIDMGTTQIFAIAAAAIAILGIFLSLLSGRTGAMLAIVGGVAGAVVLFLAGMMFRSEVSNLNDSLRDALQEQGGIPGLGGDLLQANNEIGFWLSLVAFLLAALWGIVLLMTARREPAPGPAMSAGFGAEPPPPAPPPEPPPQE